MSFIKRFSKVDYKNFADVIDLFRIELEHYFLNGKQEITITLYSAIPDSITSLNDDLQESLNISNKKLVFKEILARKIESRKDFCNFIREEDFEKAAFVRVVMKNPDKTSSYFTCIEFKGLLPKHVVCYIQPEGLAEIVFTQMKEYAPLGLFAKIGDGTEKNHHISFS